MPHGRLQRMPPEKRERLFLVAAREFAAHGFEAASLNRILGAANVGKSSAYYYFEDKADLFCAVVRYCAERLHLAPDQHTIAALTTDTYWPTFAETHDQPLELTQQEPWLFGVIRAAERLTPDSLRQASLANLVHEMRQYKQKGMGLMLLRGQELGLVRTDLPRDLLLAWFEAIDAASDDWILEHPEPKDPALLLHLSQQTLEAIRQLLTPPEHATATDTETRRRGHQSQGDER